MGNWFSNNALKFYICYNSLTHTGSTLGTIYQRYPSNGQYSCPANATASDTCIFTCIGISGSSQAFHCADAGDCHFSCAEPKCAEIATIYGDNAKTLTLSAPSTGNECFKGATVYAPASGSLIFTRMEGPKAYKEMTIHAGTNTQDIIIDCTGTGTVDECKIMQINAGSAQYLEILVQSDTSTINGDNGKNKAPANIYCPVNSSYTGSEEASCIIDLTGGGTLYYANIYTTYGMPRDIWIKQDKNSSIDSVTLQCNAGTQTSNFFSTSGTCWNTRNPTTDPTTNPTISPTRDPTLSPTHDPTLSPTLPPSFFPTMFPSISPTKHPTLNPSTQPTGLTQSTLKPSSVATESSLENTKIEGDEQGDNNNDNNDNKNKDKQKGEDVAALIAIVVIVILLCLLCTCIMFFIRKLRISDDEEIEDYEQQIQMEDAQDSSTIIHEIKKKSARIWVRNFFENELKLPNYCDLFMDNGYDSLKAIVAIKGREELEEIGVTMADHQSRIIAAITQMKNRENMAHKSTIETFPTGTNINTEYIVEKPTMDGDTTSVTGTLTRESYMNKFFLELYPPPTDIYHGRNAQNTYHQHMQHNNIGIYDNNIQRVNYMTQNAQFMIGVPPPPSEIPEFNSTKGYGDNDVNPGAGDLMSQMILKQKLRIMNIQKGEGSICTSFTGNDRTMGSMESDNTYLFGTEENQKNIIPK